MDEKQATKVLKPITDQLKAQPIPRLVMLLHQSIDSIAEEAVKTELFGMDNDMLVRHLMLTGLIVSEMLSRYENSATEKG